MTTAVPVVKIAHHGDPPCVGCPGREMRSRRALMHDQMRPQLIVEAKMRALGHQQIIDWAEHGTEAVCIGHPPLCAIALRPVFDRPRWSITAFRIGRACRFVLTPLACGPPDHEPRRARPRGSRRAHAYRRARHGGRAARRDRHDGLAVGLPARREAASQTHRYLWHIRGSRGQTKTSPYAPRCEPPLRSSLFSHPSARRSCVVLKHRRRNLQRP